jgi:hypothetical protein
MWQRLCTMSSLDAGFVGLLASIEFDLAQPIGARCLLDERSK